MDSNAGLHQGLQLRIINACVDDSVIVKAYFPRRLKIFEYAPEGLVLHFPRQAPPKLSSRGVLCSVKDRLLNHQYGVQLGLVESHNSRVSHDVSPLRKSRVRRLSYKLI